jgi:hypothetical protein
LSSWILFWVTISGHLTHRISAKLALLFDIGAQVTTACGRAAGLGALADLGFRGLDNDVLDPVIVTGFHASRTHKLTPGQKTANRVLAVGRAPVEHGVAHLKNWRILTKLRTDPTRATRLLRALLVLTNLEVDR